MPQWWDGLLGGANDAVNSFDQGLLGSTTEVPAGANYTPQDQRLARMAALGSAGASLLAAAQNGPLGSRARHLEQLGNAPQIYAQGMAQAEQHGMQRQMQAAQLAALQDKRAGATALANALAPAGAPGMAIGAPGQAVGSGPIQPVSYNTQGPGGGGGGYFSTLKAVENGTGNPGAKNPRSSATGDGQFIDETWRGFARANPALFAGKSEAEILAMRADPTLAEAGSRWYARENAGALQQAGLPVHDGTVALAHRFGPQGAAALLRADPSAPASSVLSPAAITANPGLESATAGSVIGGITRRFGTGTTFAGAPGGGGAPLNPQQQQLAGGGRSPPGANGNTLENMPPTLRALAAARARSGDMDGASEIVTKWMTAPPRNVQTTTVNGQVHRLNEDGSLGPSYGRSGDEEARPLTPAEVAQYPNLDPRKAYFMRNGAPTEIGSGSTNVNIQTDSAGLSLGVKRIEQARTLNDPIMSNAVPQAIMMREQLLAGLQTGQVDSATLTARTMLQGLGLLTPEQSNKADQQTLFRSLSSAMIPGMRAAGSGSSSDLDVTMFQRAAPTLATSPMGNLAIASAFIQVKTHEQLRISAMEEYLQNNKSIVGFDQHWKKNGPPMFPHVTTPDEATKGHPPGTVVILPEAAKGQVPTYPFYVVPQGPGETPPVPR